MRIRSVVIFAGILLVPATALQAQQSQEELAKAAANPLENMINVPFQNNTNFGIGPYDRTSNVLNIQPVIPLAGGKIITRTIVPIVWIPDVTAESGMASTGLGDILFTGWWVPGKSSLLWGIGPVLGIPTGGESRGSQKWTLGPSLVIVAAPPKWTIGGLANNVWSFAGDSDADDVNQGLLQYFVTRQLGQGWYVNTAPIITVDWEAEDGQKWIVPFGAGAGKIIKFGKLPVNTQVGAYYNVVKPDAGPNWQLRVQVQFMFPTGG